MNPDGRGLRWLSRLYPAWWRERYGDEFAELVASLAPDRRRTPFVLDILRGALDAHLRGRAPALGPRSVSVARQGIGDGVVIAAIVVAPVMVMTVGGFGALDELLPPESGDTGRTLIRQLTMAVPALALIMAGVRARHRCRRPFAGVRAGAVTGCTLGLLVTLFYFMIDNTLVTVAEHHEMFPTLSQQPITAWRTGWELRAQLFIDRQLWPQVPAIGTSMRTLVNIQELRTAVVTIPTYTLAGAVLALPGVALTRPMPLSTS